MGSSRPACRSSATLVVSIVEGVFTDLGPTYQAALTYAGVPADLAYDPNLSSGWPNLANYDLVLVTTSDNWWMTLHAGASEQAMLNYTGCLIVIGQDYVYGTGLSEGFATRFGIASIVQDVNFGSGGLMNLTGLGVFAGNTDSGVPCFAANPWFTDDVAVAAGANEICDWSDGSFSGQGGSENGDDSMFSSNEFACMGDLQQWVTPLSWYCDIGGGTPTVPGTWGRLKSAYR
jgi:hypothetical protein